MTGPGRVGGREGIGATTENPSRSYGGCCDTWGCTGNVRGGGGRADGLIQKVFINGVQYRWGGAVF